MRLPLWMGLLSVAGTVGVVGTTFAQPADPAAKPAAPVQPAAPAAAPGQVDPAAKKALEEAADALKNLGPSTFTIKMSTEGLGNFTFEADMKVKLIRGKTPSTHSYQMLGDFKSPGGKEGDTKVNAAMIEGKVGEWIDEEAKTLFSRPIHGGPKSEVLSKVMTPSKAFDIVFLEADPFKVELASPELTMEKAAMVNGEQCQVVKATLQGGAASRLVYISALDKIPRKYEQVMGKPGAKQQIRRFEVKDFVDAKLTLDDIHLKAPSGFKTDKIDPPPTPPPAPVSPTKPGADGKGKLDPKQDPKQDPRLTEKEREKKKQEEIERTKGKIPSDPGLVPGTTPPGKG